MRPLVLPGAVSMQSESDKRRCLRTKPFFPHPTTTAICIAAHGVSAWYTIVFHGQQTFRRTSFDGFQLRLGGSWCAGVHLLYICCIMPVRLIPGRWFPLVGVLLLSIFLGILICIFFICLFLFTFPFGSFGFGLGLGLGLGFGFGFGFGCLFDTFGLRVLFLLRTPS